MKRNEKLLNEITKLVKIKLLQEANTPPEIDDILDKLNRLGGDKSKLPKEDIYVLDYYSKHGVIPEMEEEEEEHYEEEGMPSTFFEDEKDKWLDDFKVTYPHLWIDDFTTFLGSLVDMDSIPDDAIAELGPYGPVFDFSSLEGLELVENAPERIMDYIEKNARHLSSRIKVRLKPGDRGDVKEMIDQWTQGEINSFDFAENVALILLTGSSGEPFGM